MPRLQRPNGIRFTADGHAERTLIALAAKPRNKLHHYDLALRDLADAGERYNLRKELFEAALADARTALRDTRKDPAVKAAAHTLKLADEAKRRCLDALQSKIDPKTGRTMKPPAGRAPWNGPSPAKQLQAEYDARERLREMHRQFERNSIPSLSSHDAWQRMKFPYYIDTPAHDYDKAEVGGALDLANADISVVAFMLYVNRLACQNGIPITLYFNRSSVWVYHAIWHDRLPLEDHELIAEFVMTAAPKLMLKVEWAAEADKCRFDIVGQIESSIDYNHVVDGLKDTHWANYSARDKNLFAQAFDDGVIAPPQPRPIARPIRDFKYDPTWVDPIPLLKDSGLSWHFARLFNIPTKFRQDPPARLDGRSMGSFWYCPVGSYRPSVDMIATELTITARDGDLACMLWWEKCLERVHDDVVHQACKEAAKRIVEEEEYERTAIVCTSNTWGFKDPISGSPDVEPRLETLPLRRDS